MILLKKRGVAGDITGLRWDQIPPGPPLLFLGVRVGVGGGGV